MNSKVISFQVVQGWAGKDRNWTPDVIALCEDGSMWCIGLKDFQSEYGTHVGWKRMTPEVSSPQLHGNYSNPNPFYYTTT